MDEYLIGIGKRIKQIRKEGKKTIQEIARKAHVSNGLISKIENGRTIPSLPVLLNIIQALEIEIVHFFNGMPRSMQNSYIVCRAEGYRAIEKEDDATGFLYKHIFSKQLSSIGFETVLLEIQPKASRKKVETDAFEFKYILSGNCTYLIGDEKIELKEGDSIFFDGRIPHVPRNLEKKSCRMLVFYFYIQEPT